MSKESLPSFSHFFNREVTKDTKRISGQSIMMRMKTALSGASRSYPPGEMVTPANKDVIPGDTNPKGADHSGSSSCSDTVSGSLQSDE
jgi:hypothetical protein